MHRGTPTNHQMMHYWSVSMCLRVHWKCNQDCRTLFDEMRLKQRSVSVPTKKFMTYGNQTYDYSGPILVQAVNRQCTVSSETPSYIHQNNIGQGQLCNMCWGDCDLLCLMHAKPLSCPNGHTDLRPDLSDYITFLGHAAAHHALLHKGKQRCMCIRDIPAQNPTTILPPVKTSINGYNAA